jgi:hypothetical protein
MGCYGLLRAPERGGRGFQCEGCAELRRIKDIKAPLNDDFEDEKPLKPKSVLCKKSTGMKKSVCGQWTHLLCALFTGVCVVLTHSHCSGTAL